MTRAKRHQEKGELEAPWSEILRQWAAVDPVEKQAAEHRAQQLISGGWGSVTWVDLLGER